MDLGIKGRVALVLGAGGGLGRAIAVNLAREGCAVALAGLHAAHLTETAAEVSQAGGRSFEIAWDLAESATIGDRIKSIEAALGPVDILVNISGGPPPSEAATTPSSAWVDGFQKMVVSLISITTQVLPGMRARKWGRVITCTSSGVVTPIANLALSNGLRMSLMGWSKTLAREVAKDGVTVNVVVPGRIATNRVRLLDEAKAKREGRSAEDVTAASIKEIPAGRYGAPAEFADMVAFLASDRASYVTGSVVRVDGGMIPSI